MAIRTREGRVIAAWVGALLLVTGVCGWGVRAGVTAPAAAAGSGYALEFDGDDEARTTLAHSGSNQLTLEAWVHAQADRVENETILDGAGVYRLSVERNQLRFTLTTSEGSSTLSAARGALPLETWAHVAATWDGSLKRLFIDGAEAGSQAAGGDISVSPYTFTLGGLYQFTRWAGLIDEARVWDIARSGDDVARTMQRPLFGDEAGLAGYWRLDEGTGEWAYYSSPSGADLDVTHPPILRFQDPSWAASDIAGFLDSEGRIELEPTACPCGGELRISLGDFDLVGSGTAAVSVTTDGGDAEAAELAETPGGSGRFEGQIAVEAGSPLVGDTVLQVVHGGSVTAVYEDADTGNGTPATATDTVPVDCVEPLIDAVEAEPYSWRALVRIKRDELTAGTVRYGTSCDHLTETATAAGATDAHGILLEGLNPETGYSFAVEVEDAAGNVTAADNGGSCFTFTTAGFPSPPVHDDFERGLLNASWAVSGTGEVRAEVSPSWGPRSGDYHLVLGGAPPYASARAEATMFLDLDGYENVALRFHAKSLDNQGNGPPGIPYTGAADFDGVAISEDGNTWYEVAGLRQLGSGYQQWTFDLDRAAAEFGLSYGDSFRIRFNQYDSDADAVPERVAVDDVLVWGSPPDDLKVSPLRTGVSSGVEGGPFRPGCEAALVANAGGAPVSWSASPNAEWVAVVPSGGTLEPGATQGIQVCIAAAAEELPAGDYEAFLDFTNHGSGQVHRMVVGLSVEIAGEYALGFDGGDWAHSPEYTSIDVGVNNAFTLEAWVQPRRKTHNRQTVLGGPSESYAYQLETDGEGRARFRLSTSEGEEELVTAPGAVPEETWIHLAAVWDGDMMRIYAGGEEGASVGHSGTVLNPRSAISIGSEWEGFIDEVRIWDVARSRSEIVESMLNPGTAYGGGLAGYWRMNEGGGEWANDISRSGVHLRAVGPDWVPLMRPAIRPYQPTTNDDLRCVVESGSPGYEPAISSYRWLRDGVEITDPLEADGEVFPATGAVLSHLFTTRYETYVCIVNETFFGDTRTAPMTIVDSTPTAPVVEIVPENPRAEDGLTANITHASTDADGDEVGYAFRWLRSQDGGNTFEVMGQFTWQTVPAGSLAEEDIWRFEAVPFAVGIPENEGEIGWDQVYVGVDTRPAVAVVRPAADTVAFPSVSIVWSATDADGDPITVDVYYDTDRIEGGARPIALDQAASGSLWWKPPGAVEGGLLPNLDGDGEVTPDDVFLLASRWQEAPAGERFVIFARAWAKGTTGEAFSEGEVIVPDEVPPNGDGMLQLIREWKAEW